VGEELEGQLLQAIREADRAPLPGARCLPVLCGARLRGGFTEPAENVLVRAVTILVESGRAYVYGDTIVLETQRLDGGGAGLAPLRTGPAVAAGAQDFLANVFVCQQGETQFPVPRWLADVLLRSELLTARLPRIRHYATRPVFGQDFVLLGPGWHAGTGILVHGPAVEPVPFVPGGPDVPAIQRLPTHLRTLLGEFCFRSDADLANCVGLLLTGLLMSHFTVGGKALALVDSNQAGLGKTLLTRVFGLIMDGLDPWLIHYTENDEELQKRLCATLRGSRQSIVIIDNAKVRGGSVVSSPAIETNCMAPEVSLRMLGQSANLTRPNNVLWALTMNDTRTDPDLVSRGVAVQLAHEGRPEDRTFQGQDPVAYARDHRLDLLAELAGMVIHWNQQSRPPGRRPHRCDAWARTIGGILMSAGLPEFLENAGATAAAFNSELDELAAVAEAALAGGGAGEAQGHDEDVSDMPGRENVKLAAREWGRYFREANVRVGELDSCRSSRARAIRIGQFLTPNVGREVPVEVNGRAGRAVLRVEEGRAKVKRYFFEVTWDDAAAAGAAPPEEARAEEPQARPPGAGQNGQAPAPSSAPPKEAAGEGGRPGGPGGGNAEDW
jgi:hypothetical protein